MKINQKDPANLYPQDLHIHTVFSENDSAVSQEQTLSFISRFRHAELIGISDHFHLITNMDQYFKEVSDYHFRTGTEISDLKGAQEASMMDFEYYILHCRDEDDYYKAAEILLETGKPLIIAHPISMGTSLKRLPPEAIIEINNRYVWRSDWKKYYSPFTKSFRYVIGSDAHQPHWLNQNIARQVMSELEITETILFES